MESKEHKKTIEYICRFFNLVPVKVFGANREKPNGKYFPDAVNVAIDYEVETIPDAERLRHKISKWDKSRKKVLVLVLNKEANKSFKEIYFYIGNRLCRLR